MGLLNLYLLSCYLKKWTYRENKVTINVSFVIDDHYLRTEVKMRVGSPLTMVNEIMSSVFQYAKECLLENNNELESQQIGAIQLIHDSENKQKLSVFLGKLLKDYHLNKKSNGHSRMISNRSLDFYYHDFEFEPLEDNVKFYIYLNRGVNKIQGELWESAYDELNLAMKKNPEHVLIQKYMTLILSKMNRLKEARSFAEKYAEIKKTPESLHKLATLYIRIGENEKAEQTFSKMDEMFGESKLSLLGKAQLAYKLGKGYKQILDKVHKLNPQWLEKMLKTKWEFSLLEFCDHEECMWNAAVASKYLGIDRPFDLTQMAFNAQVPSYFDAERGTIRFVKNELDHWAEIMDRYKVDGQNYQTYPENISEKNLNKAKMRKKRPTGSAKLIQTPSANIEQMLV
jgi:tetratricopeptide (TPR) repeat protein